MKSLFEPTAEAEVIARIQQVTPQATRQWGRMDVAQMLAHCGNALEMGIGTLNTKRIFIGRIIGPLLKTKYSDDKPFDRSSPTSEELKVIGHKDFDAEKTRLIGLVRRFSSGGETKVTMHPHPFFGPLSAREWGIGMYKHLDHHLRQFLN